MVSCWRLDPPPSPCPDDKEEEDEAESFLPLAVRQRDASIHPVPKRCLNTPGLSGISPKGSIKGKKLPSMVPSGRI